ncbi:MAG: hydrogenase maturation protease, partial [Armatimonadetes bacterium]|nr:hydrogenase maturation protease [Armatimonadota bacterium]
GDVALGIRLAEGLEGRVDATVMVTHDVPENYAVRVADMKPGLVLLLDAADMGLPVGSVRMILAEEVPAVPGGTHRPSLEMFAAFVRLEAGATTWLVGVQPDLSHLDMGAEMSPPIARALPLIERALVEALPPI